MFFFIFIFYIFNFDCSENKDYLKEASSQRRIFNFVVSDVSFKILNSFVYFGFSHCLNNVFFNKKIKKRYRFLLDLGGTTLFLCLKKSAIFLL
jgi:hypothetical protein